MGIAAMCFVNGSEGWSANTAQQVIHFEVRPVNELTISGQPTKIVIVTTEGVEGEATEASTTYAISTNEASKKITGSLTHTLPPGVSLTINLGAPEGCSSTGEKELTGTAADLVTGISRRSARACPIIYKVQAKKGSGTVPVLLTLTS